MGLPGEERTVLRRIDAELERDDPDLARRLRTFTGADGAAVSWRPPRVAVAVAASVAAVAVFLVAMVVVLAARHPCSPRTGTSAADVPAHEARPAARSGTRPC
ncbi:hypothetical protein Acsp04_36780 [Actinomadura sp. NBRC 104425]|uniref:DUF3040 domain-containing protein n=1 Tax=Actinomadura sp. NBRC 104425 TaxID=3032204 RepID=UPI0024A39E09|nr:DUF3040 domain-containing protein [Actinomadura sp. NBRC 104425]GLZ13443.1 hypothetical protein Acsp04_36780 [Actinomadura sp. NBRC 104425]